MKAGKMDRRIKIQRLGTAVDSLNNTTDVWSDVMSIWADVRPVKGTEMMKFERTVASESLQIFTYYNSNIYVTDRIVFNEKNYNIKYLREIGRKEGLELIAESVS